MSRGGRRLTVAGLGLALALGWLALRGGGDAAAGAWRAVERGTIELAVEVSGTLGAVRSAVLSPPQVRELWDYRVSFLAPEGAEVKQGMPVLGFDTSELEKRRFDLAAEVEKAGREVEQKRIELAQSQADLALELAEAEARLAKLELDRRLPSELVAALDAEASRLDRELASQEVASLGRQLALENEKGASELAALVGRRERAASRLAEVEAALQAMTVRAPQDGTVVYVSDRRQDKVKVGDQVWRGRGILEIPDLDLLEARGEVAEGDVGRLAVGQTARIGFDALPGLEVAARLVEIGTTVDWRSEGTPVRVVAVKLALERGLDRRLRPGMRLRGRIVYERREGVVRVPVEAVELTAEGPRVERRERLGSAAVALQLGRQNGEWAEVVTGLAAGDWVRRPRGAG